MAKPLPESQTFSMSEAETRLILIRHGHSRAQQEGRMPGSHDNCTGLSELGREQARALAERLFESGESAGVDRVYTSLSGRAIETCELLSKVLPYGYRSECGWCESHPGEAEGLLWSDFEERYPRRADLPDPFERRIPGGESWAEFFARAGERLKRVALDHSGERVVVVTHGGIVGASFVALGDLPIGKAFAFTSETRNTSLTEWSHNREGWRLVRYNDHAHLSRLVS
jgi:2,3-bisphosphoglycerate-dependent phosphoglycerate mutase